MSSRFSRNMTPQPENLKVYKNINVLFKVS